MFLYSITRAPQPSCRTWTCIAGRWPVPATGQAAADGTWEGSTSRLLINYLTDANCDAAQIRVTVPGYTEQVGFELEQIQVYARFVLLDCVTGYRSHYQDNTFVIKAR